MKKKTALKTAGFLAAAIAALCLVIGTALYFIGGGFMKQGYLEPWSKSYSEKYSDPRVRLAAAGLLDGRRATTHWNACDLLARNYPKVTVERDPIFVRDGNVWTSAGVTAGMDLSIGEFQEVGQIVKHLKKGERIRIGGLGILQVRKRAARMGRNPATGEAIQIKASKKVAFRASKELKEAI